MFEPNCVVVLAAPELAIKSSPVRAYMQNRLKRNMLLCMENRKVKFSKLIYIGGRFLIYSEEIERVVDSLKNCFGIHSLYLAQEKNFKDLEEICSLAVVACENEIMQGTFAVRGKSFVKEFSSKKLEEEIGGALLSAYPKLKVKLKSPEKEFFCIAQKEMAIIYFKSIPAAKGMPVGSQGRVALITDNYKKEEILLIGKLLLKMGCGLLLVGDKSIELEELEEWNCFQYLKLAGIEKSKEYYSHSGIRAFFSPANSIEEAKRDSALVGTKVFVPLLF
jgi:hypothetical protein